MADYKEDKKREEPRPISDAESEKALIEKLEREYFYKKSNGFEVESSKDQEEAREEVEKMLEISMTEELNIFYNRNEIITNLCRTLLKVWDESKEDK